jgi:WD40 repeat protein
MIDAETGREAIELWHKQGIPWSFLYTDKMGEHILLRQNAKAACVVHLGTGKLCATFPWEHGRVLNPLAVSADGKILVVSDMQSVYLVNGNTGDIRELPERDVAAGAGISTDGRWLTGCQIMLHDYGWWNRWPLKRLMSQHTHVLSIWDLSRGTHEARFPGGVSASFSPDGQTLALITEDETVELWDFPLRKPWPIIFTCAVVAAGIVYLLPVLRPRRRRVSLAGGAPPG